MFCLKMIPTDVMHNVIPCFAMGRDNEIAIVHAKELCKRRNYLHVIRFLKSKRTCKLQDDEVLTKSI